MYKNCPCDRWSNGEDRRALSLRNRSREKGGFIVSKLEKVLTSKNEKEGVEF
jgi:hypothetical protein